MCQINIYFIINIKKGNKNQILFFILINNYSNRSYFNILNNQSFERLNVAIDEEKCLAYLILMTKFSEAYAICESNWSITDRCIIINCLDASQRVSALYAVAIRAQASPQPNHASIRQTRWHVQLVDHHERTWSVLNATKPTNSTL